MFRAKENIENNDSLVSRICLIFFLSGSAALIFETVWFRLAGLVFGNSVWSATLILSGFMGGIALGNYIVSRFGDYIRRPVRLYAVTELVIAVTGISLVLFFPLFENWLTPVFRPFLDTPLLLNPLRLGFAFMLIVIPTTAMGVTLPILVKALYRSNENFGQVLGRLYGWNTLGAVSGALAGEIILIKWLGVRGGGIFAGMLNLIAAFLALKMAAIIDLQTETVKHVDRELLKRGKIPLTGKRLLFAAFLSGGIMLALEVVWFRFMILFFNGTTFVFAVMLSVVLAGIGTGGLIASHWYRFRPNAHVYLRSMALFSGILVVATYRGFIWCFDIAEIFQIISGSVLLLLFSLLLMFPVSVVSGILFTLLGRAVKEEVRSETRTAGMITMANTVGAMLGAVFSGFFLLQYSGMEISFFVLAVGYGMVAFLVPPLGREHTVSRAFFSYAAGIVFLVTVIVYPFGFMNDVYFAVIDNNYKDLRRIAVKEGLNETIFYYRYDAIGEPLYYMLVTNGHSMSSTAIGGKRYMKLFVYLPVALHPDMKSALLISYGVGVTAKALTDTKSLGKIDVVDISKDILEMSSIIYQDPGEHPLNDMRVKTHIEDGRFFLSTTENRYDLITAEPPPPKNAGIVNLYTQEYFQLIYDRLSEGGFTSYWLPLKILSEEEAKSIIRAFCNVFTDCSLWSGNGLNWILIGTRNASSAVSESLFTRQWSDPVVGPELRKLAFETPAQIGAYFIADSDYLNALTKNSLPLTDNFPHRLLTKGKTGASFVPLYSELSDGKRAMERFQQSRFIKTIWPESLREETLQYFIYQDMIKIGTYPRIYWRKELNVWEDLHYVLTRTSLKTLPLFIMRTSPTKRDIVKKLLREEKYQPEIDFIRALHEIAERNYEGAISNIEKYMESEPKITPARVYPMYLFALCMAGRKDKAEKIAHDIAPLLGDSRNMKQYWKWMESTFDVNMYFQSP